MQAVSVIGEAGLDRSFRHFHHKSYYSILWGGGLRRGTHPCLWWGGASGRSENFVKVRGSKHRRKCGSRIWTKLLRCCAREFPQKRSHTFTAMFLFVCHATCVFENVSLSMKSLSWWNLNCVARLSDFEHIILRFKFDDRHKKYEMKWLQK